MKHAPPSGLKAIKRAIIKDLCTHKAFIDWDINSLLACTITITLPFIFEIDLE
jgi:hypothetical protein